jgi:hypothetical protein
VTPAAAWSPADYFAASRRARRAWERTDSQLTFGLDEADEGTPFWGASVSSSPDGPSRPPQAVLPGQPGSAPTERSQP